jgi:hypothetical protein
LSGHRGSSLDVALAVVALSVFRGACKLHRFVTAAPIVTIAIFIAVVSVTIAISIAVVSVTIPISVAIVVFVMFPIAFVITDRRGVVHQKVRAASAVNPDAILIESPRRALRAGRLATLPLHTNPGARIGRAVVSVAIFRGTRQSVLGKALRAHGYGRQTEKEGRKRFSKHNRPHSCTLSQRPIVHASALGKHEQK